MDVIIPSTALVPRRVELPHAPLGTLRRVVFCSVPLPALVRLRLGDVPLLQAAASALHSGLALPLPEVGGSKWYSRRLLAVPVCAEDFCQIFALARGYFAGDLGRAAGWAIARGTGMNLPLPVLVEPNPLVVRGPAKSSPPIHFRPQDDGKKNNRADRQREVPPLDDVAPSGDQLRQEREGLGLSQRDLAYAAGLSRGLIAEIERGRRRHVVTRLRFAEALKRERQRLEAKASHN